jgi:hypothetical protein
MWWSAEPHCTQCSDSLNGRRALLDPAPPAAFTGEAIDDGSTAGCGYAPGSFKEEENMKRTMMSFVITGALACAAPLAFAQSSTDTQDTGMQHPQSGAITHQPPYQSTAPMSSSTSSSSQSSMSSQSNMSSSSMGSGQMMGEHSMSGTVESVTSKGFVSLRTDEGTLKLHFPDASQNLKKGDKITVHLSYSKDSGSSSM